MPAELQGIRVFNPHVGIRDGLEFTATFSNNSDRPCFITGTALGILRGDVAGNTEAVFNARFGEIAIAVSRKAPGTPVGDEIIVNSDDVSAPDR